MGWHNLGLKMVTQIYFTFRNKAQKDDRIQKVKRL